MSKFIQKILNETKHIWDDKYVSLSEFEKEINNTKNENIIELFKKFKESNIIEPKEEIVDEHERLINVLKSKSHKDDKDEYEIQKKELKKYKK